MRGTSLCAPLDFDPIGWLGWTWRSKVTLPAAIVRSDAGLVDQSRLLRAVNVADTTYLQTEAPPIILF